MNFEVIFFKKESGEFLSNMFWNHQDVSFWVVCFACYKPADPLQRIVDTVREGGRDFTGGMPTGAGPGRLGEQVDNLAADASVSRYPRRHHAQGEGDTKQAIDLARIDSKSAVYRSPAQSPQSSS